LALDENIYEIRREKLKKIEASGIRLIRGSTTTATPCHRFWPSIAGRLLRNWNLRGDGAGSGRIMAIRLMGKAAFAHLQQDGQRLQIYAKKTRSAMRLQLWKLLDLAITSGFADICFARVTGELTIHAEELTFLSKDLLPLPEKFHGLTDVELRYRQRYVDLVMNPVSARSVFERSKLTQSLRRVFRRAGFMEVETPMMHPIAGGAVARPFKTHHNTWIWICFLRIAPELYLKRLTVAGSIACMRSTETSATRGWGGDGILSSPCSRLPKLTRIISASWHDAGSDRAGCEGCDRGMKDEVGRA